MIRWCDRISEFLLFQSFATQILYLKVQADSISQALWEVARISIQQTIRMNNR